MGTLHIHTYSDELPSFNSTSDCDYYEFAVYRYRHSHEHERSHCNGDCNEHAPPADSNADTSAGQRSLHGPRP